MSKHLSALQSCRCHPARRGFLRLLGGAATAGLVLPAFGQIATLPGMSAMPPAAAKPTLPFTAVGPFKEDELQVYAFFAFSCPFCRQHMANIAAWGATLPKPLRFEAVPICIDETGTQAARAYFAVRRAQPDRLATFEQAVYTQLQDAGAVGGSPSTYLAAAKDAHIDRTALDRWRRDGIVAREIVQARMRYERYRVEVTPSLAIGGQFVTEAGRTNGDYVMLLQLANGIISQMLPIFQGRTPS